MTKREIVERISKVSGLSREEAEDFYFMFFKGIIDSLKRREKVRISGFGVFSIKESKGKKGVEILFKPLGPFKNL
jgi:integration host factor subunit alpha